MAPQVFTQSAATAFLVAYNDGQVSEGRHGFAEVLVSLLRAPRTWRDDRNTTATRALGRVRGNLNSLLILPQE
jgi:tryptophan 2,3-dioxygenase